MGYRNPITTLRADQITSGTLGPGVTLPAAQVAEGQLLAGVIARALAADTVTSAALAAEAVTGPKIAASAVVASKIAAGAITADKIAAGAVTASRMALGVLATNLVANPGFEAVGTGIPAPGTYSFPVFGWSIPAMAGDAVSFVAVRDAGQPPSQGLACAVTTSTSTGATGSYLAADPITVRAGAQYRISGEVAAHTYSSGATATLAAWWLAGNGTILTYVGVASATIAAGAYQTLGATLTAPAGAAGLVVLLQNSGGPEPIRYYHRWDAIAVLEVGSPAVELTAAGIRMWDATGAETVSLRGSGGLIAGTRLNGAVVDAESYLDIGPTRVRGSSVDGLVSTRGFHSYGASFRTGSGGDFEGNVMAKMTSTTASANVHSSSDLSRLQRVSSLRRFKLDREPIPARYELLEVPAQTWRDAAMVDADPGTQLRVAGFVAEDVQAVSAAHGGSLDALLTWDEEDQLQGLAYDRFVAFLLPIVAQLHNRITELEDTR